MEKDELLNIIVFCILMENNDGILGKSPDYIIEKFNRYIEKRGESLDAWKWGLDGLNTLKLKRYEKKWLKK